MLYRFGKELFSENGIRQEFAFTLTAEMDDFRHKSTKFIVVFIDFADAFGSVKHEFIFETSHFGIPEKYACLIKDLYKYSTFKVICGADLTKLFFIIIINIMNNLYTGASIQLKNINIY